MGMNMSYPNLPVSHFFKQCQRVLSKGNIVRIITIKAEHVINCTCGTCIGYDINDFNKQINCPKCNKQHTLNGSHDLYVLEKFAAAPNLLEPPTAVSL